MPSQSQTVVPVTVESYPQLLLLRADKVIR